MRCNAFSVFLTIAVVVLVAGCAPSSPVERVAEARSFYEATLNGFYATPVEPEPTPEEMAESEMAEGEMAEAETAEGEEGAEAEAEASAEGEDAEADGTAEADEPMEPAGPVLSDLVLDVVVQHDSLMRLDGLTLDVSLIDASGAEKRHWLWWIETADLLKGSQAQFTRTFEDVEYEEGDGLSVEIRHPVPEAERSDYREFDV